MYVHHRPSDDSLRHAIQLTEQELEEMNYYFRIHDVADEGYHLIAAYHTTLQQHCNHLKALLRTEPKRYMTYDTIPARKRPIIAVKMNGGFWRSGRFYIHRLHSGQPETA